MLRALKDLLAGALEAHGVDAPDREHALRCATAVLLVEVARADFEEAVAEREAIRRLLADAFDLSVAESAMLLEEARTEADHAVSLQDYTRTLHEKLTVSEKHEIVEMLWRVALADERLDKHEDHLVRKIAGLLYVSHGDLIRIRNRVYAADP